MAVIMILFTSILYVGIIIMIIGLVTYLVKNKDKELINKENVKIEEDKQKEYWKDKISLSSDEKK